MTKRLIALHLIQIWIIFLLVIMYPLRMITEFHAIMLLSDIIYYIFLILLLGSSLYTINYKGKINFCELLVVLLFLYSIISMLIGIINGLELLVVLKGFRLSAMPLLLFFLPYVFSFKQKDLHSVINTFALTAVIVLPIAIKQFFFGYTYFEKQWFLVHFMRDPSNFALAKIFSTVGSGNTLAAIVLGYLCIGLFYKKDLIRGYLLIIVSILVLVIIQVKISLFVVPLLVFLAIIKGWFRRRLLVPIVIIGVVILGIWWVTNVVPEKTVYFQKSLSIAIKNPLKTPGMAQRMQKIKWVIEEVSGKYFGLGIGSVPYGNVSVIDNYFFKILIELGWPGLCVFLVILYLIIWNGWRCTIPEVQVVTMILMGFTCFFMTQDLLDNTSIGTIFWLLAGFVVAISKRSKINLKNESINHDSILNHGEINKNKELLKRES